MADTLHDRMRQRIQRLLATVLVLPPWQADPIPVTAQGCAEPSLAAEPATVYISLTYVDTTLTPVEWGVAKTTVSELAAKDGFTWTRRVDDQPGRFHLELTDRAGGTVRFTSVGTTALSIITGCGRAAAAPRRSPPHVWPVTTAGSPAGGTP